MVKFKDIEASFKEMDKKRAYLALGVLLAVFAAAFAGYGAFGGYAKMKRMAAVKKEELEKFRVLEDEYIREKAILDTVAKKAYAGGAGESPVVAIEAIGARLGIKEKIASVKPLEEKDAAGYREKPAEVRIEGVDLNQAINLFYSIENNRALLVIKEFSVKTRFEDPQLFDITMRLSAISRAAP